MKQSATDLLLYRTYEERWERGEKYANQGKVKILTYDEKHVEASVTWTDVYKVELAFRAWWLSRRCSCPLKDMCKHMVATAIVWDEMRGIPRPTPNEVRRTSISQRAITREDLEDAYNDPLSADLDIIRVAAEEYCLGSPRPHALLPKKPKLKSSKWKITMEEVESVIQEIRSRSRKRDYDMCFCAGEMVAAFCEAIRNFMRRIELHTPKEAKHFYQELKDFESELIDDLIDDSEWLHEFTEAHMLELQEMIEK